ncbi:hypothetical protein ABH920_009709 [Catenulispora sp. EB89]|uniref:hypothetical protein n=1 Tax=Catenulispora sp. EB89 TaxID=3156257 RepID=UPI003516386F
MSMTRRARAPYGRTLAAGAAVVALMAVSACGGGSSKPSSSSTSGTSTTTTSSPSPSPSSSASSSPTGTASSAGPADAAAATAQIKQNWETFFDPKTTIPNKEKYLENGTVLAPLLQGFAADPRVGQVSAAVTNVAFTSATTATVTYALSLQGTVVEPNATGKAVLQDGTWKVADATLCGLVALTGNTSLPGCS